MKPYTEDQIARYANIYIAPQDLKIKRMIISNQPDKNGEAMVYIRLRKYDPLKRKDINEKKIRTNVRVNPKFWSSIKGEVLKGDLDYQKKNRIIKEKESQISKYINNPDVDYIMAYPEEDRIETSLINGNVELQRTESDGKVIPMLKMKPTDLAIFQKNNYNISIPTIDDDRYFSWKEGKLVFNKEPIGEVVKKLGRWFNVDIQVRDPELLDLTYTATFVSETLPQVMELFTLMSPVRYSISNREQISNGTYTKRKIILFYRKNQNKI